MFQAKLLTLFIRLGIEQRVILRRRFCYDRKSGALGEIDLADILAEISFARRLDAVAAVAEIECVEIRLKDSILAVMLFKIQSALYLLELSDDRDLLVVGQVFDELLGYRRAAAA